MVIVSPLIIRHTVMSLMRWDPRVCFTSMHESTTALGEQGLEGVDLLLRLDCLAEHVQHRCTSDSRSPGR